MALGYCPHCKQNVALTKGEFNFLVFCILLFTGIGPIIYIIIWACTAQENKCVICGTETLPLSNNPYQQPHLVQNNYYGQASSPSYTGTNGYQPSQGNQNPPYSTSGGYSNSYPSAPMYSSNNSNETQKPPLNESEKVVPKFCPFCGSELNNPSTRFCQSCGNKIVE